MQVYWLKISPKCLEQHMKIELYTCYFNTVERKIMFYKLWDTEREAEGKITYKGSAYKWSQSSQSNTGNQKPDSSECHIGIFTSSGVELFHTDQTSQSYRIATPSIHWKDPCWSSDTLATWREELTQWERPDAGKTEGKRGDRGWRGRLDSITDSCMHMNWSKLQEIVEDRAAWCAAVQGVTKSWTQLSNWTAT